MIGLQQRILERKQQGKIQRGHKEQSYLITSSSAGNEAAFQLESLIQM